MYWELTEGGVAGVHVDGFAEGAGNTTSTIRAVFTAPDTTVITSAPVTINFLERPKGAKPSSITVSNSAATAGDNITVSVMVRDWAGNPVQSTRPRYTRVFFAVDGPASLTVNSVPPVNAVKHQASRQVPANAFQQVGVDTDVNGMAKIIISSTQAASARVATWVRIDREVFRFPDQNISWAATPPPTPPPASVTSIKLTPISQTVRVGRYAQLSAALTPALPDCTVVFTAIRVTPMDAQLDATADDMDALIWSEPDTTTQQAQLATDTTEPSNAEVAHRKRPGSKSKSSSSSVLSDSQGVATIRIWHRHPGTYSVYASVVNKDGKKVESDPVEVRCVVLRLRTWCWCAPRGCSCACMV